MSIDLSTQAIKPEAYLDLHKRTRLTKNGTFALLNAYIEENKHLRKSYVLLLTQRGETHAPIEPILEETLKEMPLVEGFRSYTDEALNWKGILVKII